MLKRKICVVTGSRAEYGLLFWLLKNHQRILLLLLYNLHHQTFFALLTNFQEGLHRRAQIITPKDASLLTSMLGITSGDRVLELGFGSAGLTLHLANIVGKDGLLTTVELREEHAKVGLENVALATSSWESFPEFHLVEGDAYDSATADAASSISDRFDAISIERLTI